MADQYSRKAAIAIGAILPCVVTLPTLAQSLEEVVVTATRRAERLQDVPIAVSVLSGESLKEEGFSDIESVSEFTPNLIVRDGFQGQTLQVRGVGTDTRNEAFEQAVAQFADGVYYGRDNLSLSGLFDLERVEVVRGPQPVFAGQSATAGAINTISRKPGERLEGNTTLEYGDDNERSLEAAIGGPVTDTLGVRLAGRYYDLPDAGYKQIVTGAEIGAQKIKAGRLTTVWKPTETFDANLKWEYQDVFQNGTPAEYGRCDTNLATSSAGPLGVGLPALCALESLTGIADLNTYNRLADSGGTLDVRDAVDYVNSHVPGANIITPIPRGLNLVNEYNHPESRQMSANILVGQFNWSLGQLTLSGISGLVTFHKSDWLDPDESAYAVFTDHRFEEFKQYSQEVRLTSPLDQKISWMVGVYWQTHTSDLGINVHFPFNPTPAPALAFSPGGSLHETSDWASAFFTATWNITDTVRLNAGARYQDSRKDGTYSVSTAFLAPGATAFWPRSDPAPFMSASVDSSDTLPEVGLQWKPVNNAMFYGKYAEAFKAGGFVMNPPLPAPPDPFTFLPETAKGWEIGYKGTLFNDNLQLNIAYFDTKFDDLQVNSFNGTLGRFEVRNAAAARTKGVEIDGRFAYGRYFTLGFSGGTNDAQYTSFPNGQCNQIQTRDWQAAGNTTNCVIDRSGDSLGTPEWQVSLAPQFTFPLGTFTARAGLNMTWIDSTVSPFNPTDPLGRIEGRHRIDLRLALAPERANWEVALYARDLTDEAAHIGGLQSAFFSQTNARNDTDVSLYGVGGKTFERGRRVGLQASYFLGRP